MLFPGSAARKSVLDLAFASLNDLPSVLDAAGWRALEGRLEWSSSRKTFLLREPDDRDLLPGPEPAPGEVRDPASIAPALRPTTFAEVIGQRRAVENLLLAAHAARERGEPLGNLLLSGAPGLGKTTLAGALAHEMGGRLHTAMGAVISEPHQAVSLLARLERNDLLFIDEIHRLPAVVIECLHAALEDRVLHVLVAERGRARSLRIELELFTLIGATMEPGDLPEAFRARFPLGERLDPYSEEDLALIAARAARVRGLEASPGASRAVAARSRGTPREAVSLIARALDVAQTARSARIEAEHVEEAARRLEIDADGLRAGERRILELLVARGRPMGLEALAATLRIDPATLRNVHEPYLLERGYVVRTARGREATATVRLAEWSRRLPGPPRVLSVPATPRPPAPRGRYSECDMWTFWRAAFLVGLLLPCAAAEEGRLPVPDGSAREEAAKRIRDTFKDGYARRESADRVALAAELLKLARETRGNPVERYVLFEEAASLTAQAGEIKRALGAVEERAKHYEVNLLADKAGVLAIGARDAKSGPLLTELASESLQLAEASILADRYDLAVDLLKSSRSLAGRGKDSGLLAATREKEGELEEIRRAYPVFQEAREKLAANPGDREANLAAGRFLSLLKGDWKQGLDYLVKAVEVRLTPLAKKDRAEPRSAAERVAVADSWWDLAEEEKGLARKNARARALYWYRLAMPELSGLAKRKVEERVSDPAGDRDGRFPPGCVLLLTFEKDTLHEKDGNLHARDLSGKENHGRVLGAKPAAGKAGVALSFDGVDDAVDCGSDESLNVTEAFTISAWVSSAGLKGDAVDYIVSKDDWQSGNRGFVLRCGQGGTAMLTVGSGGWKTVKGPRLERNRWYHLAATFDSETIKIYVNGVVSGSEPVPAPINPSSYNLTIGRGAYARDRRFHGLIDEVAIFDRALPPGEIKWLFERGRKGRTLR